MKKIIPVFFFFALSLGLNAQFSVEVVPADLNYSYEFDGNDNGAWNEWTELVAYSKLTNTSFDTIILKWEIELVGGTDCPEEWDFRICDKNLCYNTLVTTNVALDIGLDFPLILAPADSSIIDVSAFPRLESGCCVARVNFYEISDPDVEVFISHSDYTICVSLNPVSVTEAEVENLKVFPNPTSDFITLSNNDFVEQVWISNILGKRVASYGALTTSNYDMSNLPNGIYLVSLVEGKNEIVKTIRVCKNSERL